jgi:putative YphP/YqiW family bacilliredoxin
VIHVPYPEMLIAPMRGEMLEMGAREARTAQEVDDVVTNTDGVVMMVVNSVCGCAAGKARPGIALALRHRSVRPSSPPSSPEPTSRRPSGRAPISRGYPPSSPSIGLLKGGALVY